VGLAGPWISGGVEFNWPQHHRPATFLPADVEIEEHDDGAKTVWLGDHDPMRRMKGMHGICLHPDKAYIEIKVRAYNRTDFSQPFLWWANIGVAVDETYQSFFPPDACHVADHAKRATSEYPLCRGTYYGIDFARRSRFGVPETEKPRLFVPPHCGGKAPVDYAPNDLAWFANIPTPCSYMCLDTNEDFFGGYDHGKKAGVLHIADHHIAPGKKQWTWGNHEFGYAWNRNLADDERPYIELMAGVYTDNQPDFSFLQPGETKAWSQFLYPFQKIGPAVHANRDAALRLDINSKHIRIGVCVSCEFEDAKIRVEAKSRAPMEWKADLKPGQPFFVEQKQPRQPWPAIGTTVRVLAADGREILVYLRKRFSLTKLPEPATEPAAPEKIATNEELFLAGLHLHQYHHANYSPELYWREALRRDPGNARCNNALGLWHLQRGEFSVAEKHFRAAIARLTKHNPNPHDGEPYYNLGLCLRHQLDADSPPGDGHKRLFEDAYAAFYKATWNQAWQAAGYHALAEMDCRRGDWAQALGHLNHSLRFNTDNLRARNLKTIVLGKLKRRAEADELLRQTLKLDRLDWWARHLSGEKIACDLQVRLDVALDFAQAGFYREASALLRAARTGAHNSAQALPASDPGAAPLLHYYLGWLAEKAGDKRSALAHHQQGAAQSPDYCFPARLEEIAILESAMRANPRDSRAPYYLGNLFYDRNRHAEAIRLWERSAKTDPRFSIVWRNLGIGYFNIGQSAKARVAYERAFRAGPTDARLLYERDQLWKRLGVAPEKRLRELERHPALTSKRDDLAIELCALYNQTGQPERAHGLITNRRFQPWEGGEGLALAQHVRTHLVFGRQALEGGDFAQARADFETALTSPDNLGEAKHPLANQSDIHFWLGIAYAAEGNKTAANMQWRTAATFCGDFQQMSVRAFSEMTYFSALAWGRLGQKSRMRKLLNRLLVYAQSLQRTRAKIDYFATSQPTMLLFNDDIQYRQETSARFLQAQAHLGLGHKARAKKLFQSVLRRDPSHALALDFLNTEFRTK
jgi:tetratricopeptide (TPR) repeat protein